MKLGRYELLAEIGRGGMGVVFRARAGDGIEAAVKILLDDRPEALAAFARERRLLAGFSRAEGFVPTLDSGEDQGRHWLAMPFLPGGTLRGRLRRGPLSRGDAVALVTRLARALGRAHDRGIVHRDVKPENVLFTAEGEPLVADLGLAKHFRRDVLGASRTQALTATGEIAGTAGYAAPEQLEDTRAAGPPVDVFALGAILHECLAGQRPFQGKTLIEYGAALQERPAPLPAKTPAWLAAVVARSLARDPRGRFPDGSALARALEAGARRSPVTPRVAIALAALVLFGSAVAIVIVRNGARPEAAAPASPPRPPAPPTPPAPAPPAPRRDPDQRAVELTQRAINELLAHDLEEARDDATRAIELDPGLALAWGARSQARRALRDAAGSEADATRAIELAPLESAYWIYRADAHYALGRLDDAIADATRAIGLEPGVWSVWELRARARADRGDTRGAIADATRAIEIDPTHAMAWETRAVAHVFASEHDSAIADATRAIELDPNTSGSWAARGQARLQKGDVAGTASDFRRALELDPENGAAEHMKQWLAENAPR
jgi:tetratricopeptide (TPR) repeat protein